jgi:hypothetical protein
MISNVAKPYLGCRVYFCELRLDGQRQKQGGHPGDDFVGQWNYVEGVWDL